MKFPTYVPTAVRVHISKLLPILTSVINCPREQVITSTIRPYFEEQNKTGDYYERRFSSYLDEHLATIIDKCHRSQDLTPHKDFLIRFTQDERMREVYAWLATEYDDDESWHNLVWAATIALADFRVYRAQLRNVSGLCREIAAASNYVLWLLEQLEDFEVNIPRLYSLVALLDEGPGCKRVIPDDLVWLRLRDVLGEIARTASTTASDIDHRRRDAADPFTWSFTEQKSPENIILARALITRQNNKKTGYLRALGCGLMLRDSSALTLNVQKAMAGIATVAINDPDVVVTYDDVRAVFAQRKAVRHCPKKS